MPNGCELGARVASRISAARRTDGLAVARGLGLERVIVLLKLVYLVQHEASASHAPAQCMSAWPP